VDEKEASYTYTGGWITRRQWPIGWPPGSNRK